MSTFTYDGMLLVDSGGSGVSYTLEQIAYTIWTRTQRELTTATTLSLIVERNQ